MNYLTNRFNNPLNKNTFEFIPLFDTKHVRPDALKKMTAEQIRALPLNRIGKYQEIYAHQLPELQRAALEGKIYQKRIEDYENDKLRNESYNNESYNPYSGDYGVSAYSGGRKSRKIHKKSKKSRKVSKKSKKSRKSRK